MKDLIDRKTGRMKLVDAPVGVFVFRDEFVLKTEYMTNIDGVYIPDCYILSTGEKFWGGMKSKEDFKTKYNNLDVEVIDIMPSAHLESKRQATVSSDCISRQDAIDLLKQMRKDGDMIPWEGKDVFARIRKLPSAQPEQPGQPPYVAEIEAEYQKAVNMPYIKKPLAKALYEVWKKHDREDAERRTDEQIW